MHEDTANSVIQCSVGYKLATSSQRMRCSHLPTHRRAIGIKPSIDRLCCAVGAAKHLLLGSYLYDYSSSEVVRAIMTPRCLVVTQPSKIEQGSFDNTGY